MKEWRLLLGVLAVVALAFSVGLECIYPSAADASTGYLGTGYVGATSGTCVDNAPPCGGYLLDAGASIALVYSENFNCGKSSGVHVWQDLTVAGVVPANTIVDDAGMMEMKVTDAGAGSYGVAAVIDLGFTHQYGRWAARWKAPAIATSNWPTIDTYGVACRSLLGTDTPGCTAGATGGWQSGSLELTVIEGFYLNNGTVDQFGHSHISANFGGFYNISTDPSLTSFHITEHRWANQSGGVNDAGNGISFWIDGTPTVGVNTFGPSGPGYGQGEALIDGGIGPYSPANYAEPVGWTLDNNSNTAATPGTFFIDWLCVYTLADGGT